MTQEGNNANSVHDKSGDRHLHTRRGIVDVGGNEWAILASVVWAVLAPKLGISSIVLVSLRDADKLAEDLEPVSVRCAR